LTAHQQKLYTDEVCKGQMCELPSNSNRPMLVIVAVLLLSVLFITLVLCPTIPLGVVGEWVLERKHVPIKRCIPAIVGIVLFIIVTWRCAIKAPTSRCELMSAVTALLITSIFVRFFVQFIEPLGRHPMAHSAYTAVSPIATSFFISARNAEDEGWLNVIRNYDDFMRRQPVHSATHPPGILLLYSVIRVATKNSHLLQNIAYAAIGGRESLAFHVTAVRKLLGIQVEPWEVAAGFISSQLMLLLGALTLPFIILALIALSYPRPDDHDESTDRSELWWAVPTISLIYSTSPGQFAYVASPDQLLTFISAVGSACICIWACVKRAKSMLLLIGVLGFVGLFCSFKFAPILLMWVLLIIVETMRQANRHGNLKVTCDIATALGWFAMPMFLLGLLLLIAFGFDWLSTFSVAMHAHSAQAVSSVRTYWKWAIVNLFEFSFSIGPVLTASLKACLWHAISSRAKSTGERMLIMCVAIIILMDILGIVRGEVSRIWLPFTPPLAIGIAANKCFRSLKHLRASFTLLSLSQAVTAIFVRAFVDAVRAW